MYRILVADDEPRHRLGLVNMIKRLKPEYTVFEARNGAEALEFALGNALDIIITDIKMPIMDGLQFIEHLGDRVKETKVIILSAFGYFEYAQKAVGLGAFDYLLKPVDEEKVIEIFRKVENQIKCEQLAKQEKENMKKQLNNTLPVYLETLLNKWVKGTLGGPELSEIESIFPYKGIGTVLVSEILNFKALTAEDSSEEINEIQLNIKYWMKEMLNPLGHSISFYLQGEKTILVTILNTSEGFDLLSERYQLKLIEFIKNLKIGYGFDVVIGFGNRSDNIFDTVENIYKQALIALDNKFYLENKSIISFSELPDHPQKAVVSKYKEEEDLIEAIRKMNKEKSVSSANLILERMTMDGYPDVSQLKDSVNQILTGTVKNIQKLIGDDQYNKLVSEIPNLINDSNHFMELRTNVEHILLSMIENLGTYRDKRGDILFEKCLEYIGRHLSEDISLDTVAEEFHFNATYFSYLFKARTGVNFSQYLIEIRLKKSKELLENSGKKVYEIAQNVGYKDPKYFIRAFKKEYGMTPDEYRRLV